MKKWILPSAAAVLVIIAVFTAVVLPRMNGKPASGSASAAFAPDDAGHLTIRAEDLSETEVRFYQVDGSRIELIARKGDDGKAKVSLGTCQSCNGSPGAYYTQIDDQLECHNCGLTFPLEVVGGRGTGCYPIMLPEGALSYEGNDAVISWEVLKQSESLFEKVEEH